MFIKAREGFSRGEYCWNHEIEKLTHVSCVIDFLFIHLCCHSLTHTMVTSLVSSGIELCTKVSNRISVVTSLIHKHCKAQLRSSPPIIFFLFIYYISFPSFKYMYQCTLPIFITHLHINYKIDLSAISTVAFLLEIYICWSAISVKRYRSLDANLWHIRWKCQ